MSEAQEIDAIVVGYTDYGESDRIARLISPQVGLISVMGRSARRSTHRMSGIIDLGNQIKATVRLGKGEIWTLSKATLERGFLNIRNHIHKLALLSYFCEISSHFGQDNMPAPKLFGLLEHSLTLLDTETGPFEAPFRIGFELKALSFAGLQPPLTTCALCGAASRDEMFYLFNAGGAVHSSCASPSEWSVSLAWLQALDEILHAPLKDSVSDKTLNGPLWTIAHHIEHHIEKPLRSRAFLASLEGTAS